MLSIIDNATITALAALVAAIGAIVTAVLQYLSRGRAADTHAIASDTNTKVTTSNGRTIGELVEHSVAVADAAIPAVKAIVPDAVVPDPNPPINAPPS